MLTKPLEKAIDELEKIKKIGNANLEKTLFHKPETTDSMEIAPITFIDGGSSIILGSVNFALAIIRTYSCKWKGSEQIPMKNPRLEFFSLVFEDKNVIKMMIYPYTNDNNDPRIPDTEKTYHFKKYSHFSENWYNARNLAELTMAYECMKTMTPGEILMLDGSMDIRAEEERNVMEKIITMANEKNVFLCGLSKTTSLLTENGVSLPVAALKESPLPAPWYMDIPQDIKKKKGYGDSVIIKLYENSTYAYRFDCMGWNEMNNNDRAKILNSLSANSQDPAFPGYPYGLVEADTFAQIRTSESKRFNAEAMIYISKDIHNEIMSLKHHDYLNKVTG